MDFETYQFSDSIEDKVSSVEFCAGVAALFNGDGPALKLNDATIL